MRSPHKVSSSDYLISDTEFESLRVLFTSITGNKLGPEKRTLLESRLRKRFSETGLQPRQYLELLGSNERERDDFVSTLTTHKTDWFREPQHFDFLKKQIEKRRTSFLNAPMTIWSAACSTGEEVYSLAMLADQMEIATRILGTDISTSCLEKAKAGVYPKEVVDRQVPAHLKQKYFLRGKGAQHGRDYRISSELRERTKWRAHNLIESELPVFMQFDFIFLRNALIYFDAEVAFEIIKRLCRYMKKDGFLIVGLSENILQAEKLGLKRVDNSVFQK